MGDTIASTADNHDEAIKQIPQASSTELAECEFEAKPTTWLFQVFKTIWLDVKAISILFLKNRHGVWKYTGVSFASALILVSAPVLVLMELLNYPDVGYCPRGGGFDFEKMYNLWSFEHLFQITIGFGRLTFTQAKAVDVVWDIVFGRGGQLILTAITFTVFSKCLSRLLEQSGTPVSYTTFRAAIFEEPSLRVVVNLLVDFRSQLGWRARLSVLWFVLASAYVAIFPIIASAMTGYSANVKAYFEIDGVKQPLTDDTVFNRIVYRINDADRIERLGLNRTYLVGAKVDAFSIPSTDMYYSSCVYATNSANSADADTLDNFSCQLIYAISDYIDEYQAGAVQNKSSTLKIPGHGVYAIPLPTLSIDIFNTKIEPEWFSQGCKVPSMGRDATAIANSPCIYGLDNSVSVFNETEANLRGSCDSQLTYSWGFSFLLLFIFQILTIVWTIGMYAMWNDALWNSRLDRAGRQIGFYRGVVDISNAMWKETSWQPTEMSSEKQIEIRLAKPRNGRRIAYEEIDRDELPLSRKRAFREWRQSVPSLCRWTQTWHLINWIWFVTFGSIGTVGIFFALFLNVVSNDYELSWLLTIVCWALASCCEIVATIMLFAGLISTLWRWSQKLWPIISRSHQEHVPVAISYTPAGHEGIVFSAQIQ